LRNIRPTMRNPRRTLRNRRHDIAQCATDFAQSKAGFRPKLNVGVKRSAADSISSCPSPQSDLHPDLHPAPWSSLPLLP